MKLAIELTLCVALLGAFVALPVTAYMAVYNSTAIAVKHFAYNLFWVIYLSIAIKGIMPPKSKGE